MARTTTNNPWLRPNVIEPDNFCCPECRSTGTLDHAYIGDLEQRGGFLVLWCTHCLIATRVSRVLFPTGAIKSYAFDDAPALSHLRLRELSEFD